MTISDFIERSNCASTPEALFDLFVAAAAHEGFGNVAYGALTYRHGVSMSNQPAPAVALNYPLAWQRRYFEQGYHHIDPVVIHTPAIARPFQWSDLPKRFTLTQRQTLLFNEAREAGLRSGVSVPLHGPWGRVAVVSYAADHDRSDAGARLGQLNALAAQFHVALSQFGQTQDAIIELSQRERDCLAWTAQGKSSWDIGMILNISENTVNFHIKNVMRKLDTTSRTVAVVKAIRLGLIEIANLG